MLGVGLVVSHAGPQRRRDEDNTIPTDKEHLNRPLLLLQVGWGDSVTASRARVSE